MITEIPKELYEGYSMNGKVEIHENYVMSGSDREGCNGGAHQPIYVLKRI